MERQGCLMIAQGPDITSCAALLAAPAILMMSEWTPPASAGIFRFIWATPG
jgi:hypothetical protein